MKHGAALSSCLCGNERSPPHTVGVSTEHTMIRGGHELISSSNRAYFLPPRQPRCTGVHCLELFFFFFFCHILFKKVTGLCRVPRPGGRTSAPGKIICLTDGPQKNGCLTSRNTRSDESYIHLTEIYAYPRKARLMNCYSGFTTGSIINFEKLGKNSTMDTSRVFLFRP